MGVEYWWTLLTTLLRFLFEPKMIYSSASSWTWTWCSLQCDIIGSSFLLLVKAQGREGQVINNTLKLWILRRYQSCHGCSWTPSTFLFLPKPYHLLLEGGEPCLHVHTLQDSLICSVSFSFEETIHDLWIRYMHFRLFINEAVMYSMLWTLI